MRRLKKLKSSLHHLMPERNCLYSLRHCTIFPVISNFNSAAYYYWVSTFLNCYKGVAFVTFFSFFFTGRTCDSPPISEFVKLISGLDSTYYTGHIITLDCWNGYSSNYSMPYQVECLSTGIWSDKPKCYGQLLLIKDFTKTNSTCQMHWQLFIFVS